ncbi:UdgX family uracil-DNA binding protein [Actinopolymorpha alba]|uniref:UdgX family uracil-DNA binding protein n=1 Tax=Actinopolymorpha alba TaxID=533267 RepID=UPI0004772B81|nr:UdgX family uracil-DNA binding protein [Actinopolymorpha alba]
MARIPARTAAEFVPEDADLAGLKDAARSCEGCDLYLSATQTVFGDGDPDARVVLLGEQPGDQEDRRGQPFVGPAGRVLDQALVDAGIDRSRAYVTNAVKHFKFTRPERGKRRLHKTPNRAEILACRPWLEAELALLEPELLICLGATAAKAIFGPAFKVTEQRGIPLPRPNLGERSEHAGKRSEHRPAPVVVATIHPSAVLRAENQDEVYAGLVADLRVAADVLT